MPETIIEDVFRELTQEHALLSKINFQDVKYLTRWILNDHTKQTAVWGPINGEITKKLESSFRESCFLFEIAHTMLCVLCNIGNPDCRTSSFCRRKQCSLWRKQSLTVMG